VLQQGQLLGQFPAVSERRAHLNEGPHNEDAHLARSSTVEDIGGHDGPVLSEGIGKVARVPVLLGTGHNL
jgi:hypothetical protein